jgi:hypothetical protein
MAENRIPREQESRTAEARKPAWRRPETLPEPAAADGFKFRWIRLSSLGNVDATNISGKMREGWVPVKASEHPEIFMAATENERFKENVVIGGLMLCKAPVEMVEERTKFYQDQTAAQMNSVDNNLMRENDARMPIFNDRKTKVTFGTGN